MSRPLTRASLLWLSRLEEVAARSGWSVTRSEREDGRVELVLSLDGRYLQVFVSPGLGARDRRNVYRWSSTQPHRAIPVRDAFTLARIA